MQENITVSMKELDELGVIEQVLSKGLTGKEAGKQLGISQRQVWRKVKRVREEGRAGIMHRLRGRASNRRLSEEKEEAIKHFLVVRDHQDFGPTFASEKLLKYEGIRVSVSKVWQLQKELGLRCPKKRGAQHRSWRERRSSRGEFVQVDGSHHDWFEGRGAKCVLINYVDDATGEVLYAEFSAHEDTRTLMSTLQRYLELYGRPVGLYADRDSIFKVNRQATLEEELRDMQAETQFARALRELNIGLTCAHSPQAKGRVERSFGVDQDRLVKELRLARISDMASANEFLWTTYIADRNARFAIEPKNPTDAHRPLLAEHKLEEILSRRTTRTIQNDYTVRYDNQYFQVLKEQPIRVYSKQRVEVEQRLDGSLHLRYKGVCLRYRQINKRPQRRRAPAVLNSKQMARKEAWKPAEDHPWRGAKVERRKRRPRGAAPLATLIPPHRASLQQV